MRYSGKLGFVQQTQVSPGVWEETITERDVVGDMEQRTEALALEGSIHPTYATRTSVSVLAFGVGQMDNSMIRYVTYGGKRWLISSIVNQPPRIVLYIGEEYHGPTPSGTA